MTIGMFIEAPELSSHSGVRHAFFTRRGGVSEGVYASLNGGLGSSDDPARVRENRRRMAAQLGFPAEALVSVHQVHSPEAIVVEEPFPAPRPRADGMATRRPGLALAITTADCGPVLFADPEAGVVGACHAGWRGALSGILAATLLAMEGLGARRERTIAVLGPTIGPNAYEVGPEFVGAVRGAGRRERALLPGQRPRRPFDVRPARLYRCAARGGRRRRSRRSQPLHLLGRGRLLQLPPRHPPRRDRLRPADLGDRPHALSAIAPASPEPAPKARALVPAAETARGAPSHRCSED